MIGRLTRFEPARYLMVGGSVALVNNIVLIGGDRLGLHYTPLIVATWAIGGTLGYLLHSHFTFRAAHGWAAYVRFMGGVALGTPIAWMMMAGLKSGMGLPMWIAAPAVTLGMVLYNYLSARAAILWRRFWPVAR